MEREPNMSSKAENALTARAARAANRESGEQEGKATPPGPRAKTVRLTLDLSPIAHRELTKWCADTAFELGYSKVPATAVIRLLVGQLGSDPELAARIQGLLPGELTQ